MTSEDNRQLEASDFEQLLGEVFRFGVHGGESEIEATLERVQKLECKGYPEELRKPFSLDFKMSAGANVGQCLLWAKTEKQQNLPDMFLVPRASDEEGWYMDTTFN